MSYEKLLDLIPRQIIAKHVCIVPHAVSGWRKRGRIPKHAWAGFLLAAEECGVLLTKANLEEAERIYDKKKWGI